MDWGKIYGLLSVIHQAAAAGPKYAKWAAAADKELEDMWNQPVRGPYEAPADSTAPPPADGSTEFTGDPEPSNNLRRI